MNYAEKLFEKIKDAHLFNPPKFPDYTKAISVDDLVSAFIDKNREIKESTKKLFKNIDKINYIQHEYYSQARAFREFVKKCEEVKK